MIIVIQSYCLYVCILTSHRKVIQFYMDMFASLENDGLDIDNDLHIYVLQYMFMPRIQHDLDIYRMTHNGHAITTEGNKTPNQLMLLHKNTPKAPVDIDEWYGYDDDVEPDEVDDGNGGNGLAHHTIVNPRLWPLSVEALFTFEQEVVQLSIDDHQTYFVDKYMAALAYANSLQ